VTEKLKNRKFEGELVKENPSVNVKKNPRLFSLNEKSSDEKVTRKINKPGANIILFTYNCFSQLDILGQ
jgi:hypothetical protein